MVREVCVDFDKYPRHLFRSLPRIAGLKTAAVVASDECAP